MAILEDLTPQQVKAGLDAHGILLVDVREPGEFEAERIHGALLFPLSSFDPAALPDSGDRRIVLQCGSGKRSAMAAERCQKAGVHVTAHLAGGIGAWKAAGLPTVTIDPETGWTRDVR